MILYTRSATTLESPKLINFYLVGVHLCAIGGVIISKPSVVIPPNVLLFFVQRLTHGPQDFVHPIGFGNEPFHTRLKDF